jgi:diguanylate cyclase (GGDEF)-like protein
MDRIKRALERAQRHPQSGSPWFSSIWTASRSSTQYGHLFGDKLLALLRGLRLNEAIRGLDTLARFGGDEFIVLLEEIASLGEAVKIVKRIRDLLKQPFHIDGKELWVTASFGIVMGGAARPGRGVAAQRQHRHV